MVVTIQRLHRQNTQHTYLNFVNILSLSCAGDAISGAVVRFVNAVAAAVVKLRPAYASVRIDTLAYQETLKPPSTTAPAENVTIRICPFTADFHLPFTDKENKGISDAFQVRESFMLFEVISSEKCLTPVDAGSYCSYNVEWRKSLFRFL